MRIVNPNVSVDCVVFGYTLGKLKVLLIKRDISEQDNGKAYSWTLPGDLINDDENLDQAAYRVLKDLTSLENIYLRQFQTFGEPDRVKHPKDMVWLNKTRLYPDARVITVAYYALVNIKDLSPSPAHFALEVEWQDIDAITGLLFDHDLIVKKGVGSLRQAVIHSPIIFELLPKKFTLTQVQQCYETILAKEFDKRNFRKKMIKSGILIPLNEKQTNVTHKPAQFYMLNKEAGLKLEYPNMI